MSTFSSKLKFMCEKFGFHNKEVAEKVGVTPSTITHLIKDGSIPKSDLLFKLSCLFNVSMEYFMNPDVREIDFTQSSEYKLTENEKRLVTLFSQLDELNQQEIIKFVELKLTLKKDLSNQLSSLSGDKLMA